MLQQHQHQRVRTSSSTKETRNHPACDHPPYYRRTHQTAYQLTEHWHATGNTGTTYIQHTTYIQSVGGSTQLSYTHHTHTSYNIPTNAGTNNIHPYIHANIITSYRSHIDRPIDQSTNQPTNQHFDHEKPTNETTYSLP